MNVTDETEQRFREYWTCLDDVMTGIYAVKPLTVAAIDVSVCECVYVYLCVGRGGGSVHR